MNAETDNYGHGVKYMHEYRKSTLLFGFIILHKLATSFYSSDPYNYFS